MRSLHRLWSLRYFLVVVGLLAAVPVAIGVSRYGDRSIWPGWIGNFSAGVVAFLVALYADRRWAAHEIEAAGTAAQEGRVTEARRAFLALVSELTEAQFGLDEAIRKLTPGEGHEWWVLPNLPTGAWQALAPRLGVLIDDVQLIADLGVFNAKVDDVRWSLRYRLETGSETVESNLTTGLSNWVRPMAEAARADLETLLPRVMQQSGHPSVRPIGISFNDSGTIRVRVHRLSTVEANLIRADEPPSQDV